MRAGADGGAGFDSCTEDEGNSGLLSLLIFVFFLLLLFVLLSMIDAADATTSTLSAQLCTAEGTQIKPSCCPARERGDHNTSKEPEPPFQQGARTWQPCGGDWRECRVQAMQKT